MRRLANSVIAGVTVVALCSGAWLLRSGTASHAPPQPSAAQAHIRSSTSSASGAGNTSGASSRTGSSGASGVDEPVAVPLPPSPPDRIRIPSIGVDAPLMELGLTPVGSLDVPPAEKENLAGWYEAGTTPGARGTSIVMRPRGQRRRSRRLLRPRRAEAGRHRRGGPAGRRDRGVHGGCGGGVRRAELPRPEGVRGVDAGGVAGHHLWRRVFEGDRLPGQRGRLRPPHGQPRPS